MTTYTNRAGDRKRGICFAPKSTSFAIQPAGISGGTYKPLSERDCDKIIEAALTLLEDVGMGETPERLADLFLETGAEYSQRQPRLFPILVEDTIAKVAFQRFVFHGRDPDRFIEVGGCIQCSFCTGGCCRFKPRI